jgi:hypothetical protein
MKDETTEARAKKVAQPTPAHPVEGEGSPGHPAAVLDLMGPL